MVYAEHLGMTHASGYVGTEVQMLSKVGGTSTGRALLERVVVTYVLGMLVQPMFVQQQAESAPAEAASGSASGRAVKKPGSSKTSATKSSATKTAPNSTLKTSVTEADRLFFEKLAKRVGTDQEVLLLAVIADELEGNYSVVQKLRDLQNMFANNKRGRLPIEAEVWICGKFAYL